MGKPVEFFPDIQPKSMYVNVEPPEGADLEYVDRLIKRVEMAITGATAAGVNNPGTISAEDYARAYLPKEHRTADGAALPGPSDLSNIRNVYTKAVTSGGGASMFGPNTPNTSVCASWGWPYSGNPSASSWPTSASSRARPRCLRRVSARG